MRGVAFVLASVTLAVTPVLAQPILSHPAPPTKIGPAGGTSSGGLSVQPAGGAGGTKIGTTGGSYVQQGGGSIGGISAKAQADAAKLTPEQLAAEQAKLQEYLKQHGSLSAEQDAMLKVVTDMLAKMKQTGRDVVNAAK